ARASVSFALASSFPVDTLAAASAMGRLAGLPPGGRQRDCSYRARMPLACANGAAGNTGWRARGSTVNHRRGNAPEGCGERDRHRGAIILIASGASSIFVMPAHGLAVLIFTVAVFVAFTSRRIPIEVTSLVVLVVLPLGFTLFPYGSEAARVD